MKPRYPKTSDMIAEPEPNTPYASLLRTGGPEWKNQDPATDEHAHSPPSPISPTSDNKADLHGEPDYYALHRGSPQPWRLRPSPVRWTAAPFNWIRMHRWALDVALLFVIAALLADRAGWTGGNGGGRHNLECTGDITGFAPQFAQQITTFKPDPLFMPDNTSEFFTDAVEKKWLSIVPKGLGYLHVKDPSQYDNLPHTLHNYPGKFVVTTSMTHQLHCLHALAKAYSALDSGRPMETMEGSWHLGHCIDYIRQGIMCCADVAVEGKQTTFPPGFVGSDGWDAKHVCKDYDAVLDYLEGNAVNQDEWI